MKVKFGKKMNTSTVRTFTIQIMLDVRLGESMKNFCNPAEKPS